MVRAELAMKDGEEYERMTEGWHHHHHQHHHHGEEYERMTGGWRGLDWF